jgi:hypothetical protein
MKNLGIRKVHLIEKIGNWWYLSFSHVIARLLRTYFYSEILPRNDGKGSRGKGAQECDATDTQ